MIVYSVSVQCSIGVVLNVYRVVVLLPKANSHSNKLYQERHWDIESEATVKYPSFPAE